MMSLTTYKKILIATHNAGKVKEFAALINHDGLELVSAAELNLPEPEETGKTFSENAELKARAAAVASGLPALADDSGLVVDALDGQPGIYSARWAEHKNFAPAFTKIESMLREKGLQPTGQKAAFICVLALCMPDGAVVFSEGRVDGTLCFPPQGLGGFGYDPIFIPDGDTRSFANMSAAEKHGYSHRGRAVAELKKKLEI